MYTSEQCHIFSDCTSNMEYLSALQLKAPEQTKHFRAHWVSSRRAEIQTDDFTCFYRFYTFLLMAKWQLRNKCFFWAILEKLWKAILHHKNYERRLSETEVGHAPRMGHFRQRRLPIWWWICMWLKRGEMYIHLGESLQSYNLIPILCTGVV